MLQLSLSQKNISDLFGWKTSDRIVVIESDDWGSIRMPSAKVFENLQQSGIDMSLDESDNYSKYDTLETSTNLEALFNHLNRI